LLIKNNTAAAGSALVECKNIMRHSKNVEG
jgi:hypothetical protein